MSSIMDNLPFMTSLDLRKFDNPETRDDIIKKLVYGIVFPLAIYGALVGLYNSLFLSIIGLSADEAYTDFYKTSFFGILIIIISMIFSFTETFAYLFGMIYEHPIILIVIIFITTTCIYYAMTGLEVLITKKEFKKTYYFRGLLFGLANIILAGIFILMSFSIDKKAREYKSVSFSGPMWSKRFFSKTSDIQPDKIIMGSSDDINLIL